MSEAWHPHPYQQQAVEFALDRPAAGLFLDPGLGKTSIMLKVLQHLDGPALVLAPLRVARHVWRQEASKWQDFADAKVALLHGDRRFDTLKAGADIFVANYESLPWLTATTQWKYLRRCKTLVTDESSKLKNNDTQRFRILKPKLPTFDRRYILTGSPAPNSLLDLWSQLFLLDGGERLSPFVTHFRYEHFTPLEFGYVLKPGHDTLIHAKIADICLRLSADDYLTLPDRVTSTVLVDLPAAARVVYTTMEEEFFALLESDTVTALSKGGALSKCRQIASGALYTDFLATTWETLHQAKDEALRDRLDETGGSPVMVAYQYRHSLARLRALLGADTPSLPASTPGEEDRIIAQWNNGELPVLLVQPASVGHGLNLQGAAHHLVYYDLPWNFDDYDQCIRRLQRQGQRHSTVFVTHLVAENTVDQVIERSLRVKDTRQQSLLTYLKEYRQA